MPIIATTALALLSNAGGPAATKAYVALADHVDAASLVCIGTVEEIREVPKPPGMSLVTMNRRSLVFARIAVERVLKGAPETTSVWHEAWPTWACDETDAEVGKRALFLLNEERATDACSDDVRASIRAALGGADHYRNVGSGDGILTIESPGGVEHVRCLAAPERLRSEVHRYSIPLATLLAYVGEVIRFDPAVVQLHAKSGWGTFVSNDSFDLRVLPSGSMRLATHLGNDELVELGKIPPEAWARLLGGLAAYVGIANRVVGPPFLGRPVRQLSIRARHTLILEEPKDWDPTGLENEARFASLDALQAWALVTATIECPGAEIHVEKDRAWLAELRRPAPAPR